MFTPVTLLQEATRAFASTSKTVGIVQVRGIYKSSDGTNYNGIYYDSLVDEVTERKLTLRIPERIKIELVSGKPYLFEGSLFYRMFNDKSGIDVNLYVQKAVSTNEFQPTTIKRDIERAEVLRAKQELGFKNVDDFLRRKLDGGEKPKLSLVYGERAVVDEDFYLALGSAKKFYEIEEVETPVGNARRLAETLKMIISDAVVIIRGGGELNALNNVDLVKAAAYLDTPLITGLGHAVDHPLLEQVADKPLSTPTAVGVYLKEIPEQIEDLKQAAKQVAKIELDYDYAQKYANTVDQKQRELEQLQSEKLELIRRIQRQRYWSASIIIVLLFITVLGLYMLIFLQ
jgi:exodeoxyribonuclease VII large subunit